MYNMLKVNANIEINDKNILLFPVSQINVRFSVECTSFNAHIGRLCLKTFHVC